MARAHLTAPQQKPRHAGLLQAAGQTIVRRTSLAGTRPANPRSSTGTNTPHHIPHRPSLQTASQSHVSCHCHCDTVAASTSHSPHNTVQVLASCLCEAYCHMQVLCYVTCAANMSQLPRPTRTPKAGQHLQCSSHGWNRPSPSQSVKAANQNKPCKHTPRQTSWVADVDTRNSAASCQPLLQSRCTPSCCVSVKPSCSANATAAAGASACQQVQSRPTESRNKPGTSASRPKQFPAHISTQNPVRIHPPPQKNTPKHTQSPGLHP